MRRRAGFEVVLLLSGCLAAGVPVLWAQNGGSAQTSQTKQNGQTPSAPSGGNPFPESETNVPVMPSRNMPDIPAMDGAGVGAGAAPAVDSDPVRSPEEEMPAEEQDSDGFSSSQSGISNITTPPPEPRGRRKKGDSADFSMPKETPKQDISVGNYYMDIQDWRGALSRFQSALVLDPENPEVYWGMAECQRHLGQFAAARENYLKVMEYDPDSHRAKQAKKALRDPELANAK